MQKYTWGDYAEFERVGIPGIYTGDLLFFGRDRGIRIATCCRGCVFVRLGKPVWHAAGLVFSDPDSGKLFIFVVPFAREPPFTVEFYSHLALFFMSGDPHAALGHRRTSYVHVSRVQRKIAPGVRTSDAAMLVENSVHATKYCHHAMVRALFYLDMAPSEWVEDVATNPKKPSAYAKSLPVFMRAGFYPGRWRPMVVYRVKVQVKKHNTGPDPGPGPGPRTPGEPRTPEDPPPRLPLSADPLALPPPPPMPTGTGIDFADISIDTTTELLPPPPGPPSSRPQPPPAPIALAATSDPFCI
jgi:hypothetical protein